MALLESLPIKLQKELSGYAQSGPYWWNNLPPELRDELALYLRGDDLLAYCQEKRCSNAFWKTKIFRDFGVRSEGDTREDYHVYMLGEIFQVYLTPTPYDVALDMQASLDARRPVSRDTQEKIRLMLSNPITATALIMLNLNKANFDHMWDTYPFLQRYLLYAAFSLGRLNLLGDRDLTIRVQELVPWMMSRHGLEAKLSGELKNVIHV